MIQVRVTDPITGESIQVLEQMLPVQLYSCPPLLPQKNIIFRQYFTDDGTAAGSEDMRVNAAAATPIQFWIPASQDGDRYITNVNFVIADAGANLNQFGAIAALANGCYMFYERQDQVVDIHPALQSNWDFVRLALCNPEVATIAASEFRASNVVGLSEAYSPTIDFTRLMPPYGLKLDMGTNQRLVIEIRDDTRAVDGFDAIAYGFDRLE